MIVVDTSALMAIVRHEAERELLLPVLLEASSAVMSAGTVLEAACVYAATFAGAATPAGLYDDLSTLKITVVPFSVEQATLAAEARFRFGKGRGGPLNFGDCFSYALAKSLQAPLLFKGNDFGRTDVRSAA